MDQTKQEIRKCFNKGRKFYNKYNIVQQFSVTELINMLDRTLIKKPGFVLDLGCGNGAVLEEIKKAFSNNTYIGLDIADCSLDEIKSTIIKICADIEQLPIASNSIDVIFSNMSFQWLTDYNTSFNSIYRTLTKEGLLVFSMPIEGSFSKLKNVSSLCFNQFHSDVFIKSLLQNADFNIIKSEMKTYTIFFRDTIESLKSITKLGAGAILNENISKISLRQSIREIDRSFEGQTIPLDYKLLFIVAQKIKRDKC